MTRFSEVWSGWGLISRLMLAVGIAILGGGGVQTYLLIAEGAAEHSARLKRELTESLNFISPLVADQALVGEYAAIDQLLRNQVKKGELDIFKWTDKDGRPLQAMDTPDVLVAPKWFITVAPIEAVEGSIDVTSGGVGYGTLYAKMTSVKAHNRLWLQFVKQLQIVAATLFLMLQLIWLIFRGNLGTLRSLADSANRFSQGDRSVRIAADGAPEVRVAAEAFNNMANNTENLLDSLGKSESKNRLLATIVEQSSEAIWTKDLDGVVTSWNSGAANMLGYSTVEAIGHALNVSASTPAEEEGRLERLAAGERFSYDAKTTTKAGTPIDIQVAVAPLMSETNDFVGTIAVARDVTQSKRSEEALRLAREAAEAANHAKSSFLARMSHEIRTPMNGVLGMTELLLETGLTSVQRKYAETVQSSGKNLLAIINDVLDFSKIEAGKLELEHVDMNLRRTIEDIVDLLAERAHVKGLELACTLPAGVPVLVKGDPLRLGQVLTNLTGNAIKFTQTGAVVIGVSAVDETAAHASIRFEVSDTGVGIRSDAQARIFEEFSQADGSTTRKHGGSGLGLAISRQLVEMMGGSIEVSSELGKGSTFSFVCRFEKQPHIEHVAASDANAGALVGIRALIVESSAMSRGILHSQVGGWGMEIRIADTPGHALQLLTEAAEKRAPFDLAIIDLGLPGIDTLELSRSIKANPTIASVRLVMLTPVGNHALIRDSQEAGINACLVKPVRQSDLYESVVNAMAGRTKSIEPDPAVDDLPHLIATGSRGKVLLVEDNLVNQAVALGMLNKLQGYDVTVVNNGREAVDAYVATSFDLVLMDCHMPEMDGFEATMAIRKHEAAKRSWRTPIVALTANAMAQDREDCITAGMDDHLSKPFSRVQLQAILTRWMPQRADAKAGHESPKTSEHESETLDRRVLQQLRELQDADDPHLLSRVIELYLSDSVKLMERFVQAVGARDVAEIERTLHTLKSSSANVGATHLSRLCNDTLSMVRQSAQSPSVGMVDEMRVRHIAVHAALTEELAGTGNES